MRQLHRLLATLVFATLTAAAAGPALSKARGAVGAHVVESGTYLNSSGHVVHRPAHAIGGVPAGASARCRDGTYSFSEHRRGTCSHHGGVAAWL